MRTWVQSVAPRRPSCQARTIGSAISSSCCPSSAPCRRPRCSATTTVRLLHAPQEVEQRRGGGAVAGRLLRGGDVVEVARPDEVVRTGGLGVSSVERAPHPRHRRRGDRGAAVELVLGGGEHEQRLVVQLEQRGSPATHSGGALSAAGSRPSRHVARRPCGEAACQRRAARLARGRRASPPKPIASVIARCRRGR